MGRWSQRSRAGGGPGPLNMMLSARITGIDTVLAQYLLATDGTQIDPGGFASQPSSEPGDVIADVTSREIQITFAGNIGGDTRVEYTGDTPRFLTPQTIFY